MDEPAVATLVTFMRLTANVGTNAIQCLHLASNSRAPLYEAATTMLIGSSLEEIIFKTRGNQVNAMDFLRGLVSNASCIRLRRLTFETVNVAEFEVLTEFLRQTAQLEHLCILQMNDAIDAASLLSALRQNGSLLAVDIQAGGPTLNESQRQRILAYFERNRHTPKLLAKPKPAELSDRACDSDSVNGDRTETEEPTWEEENVAATTTALEIFPKLYSLPAQFPIPC